MVGIQRPGHRCLPSFLLRLREAVRFSALIGRAGDRGSGLLSSSGLPVVAVDSSFLRRLLRFKLLRNLLLGHRVRSRDEPCSGVMPDFSVYPGGGDVGFAGFAGLARRDDGRGRLGRGLLSSGLRAPWRVRDLDMHLQCAESHLSAGGHHARQSRVGAGGQAAERISGWVRGLGASGSPGLAAQGLGAFPRGVPLRQASLQKRTSSQQRAHFLRQRKGRWQVGQVLAGRFSFLTPRIPIHCPDSPCTQTGARIPGSGIGIRPLTP